MLGQLKEWAHRTGNLECPMERQKLWTPLELAELWNLSVDTIRRMFRKEQGVLFFGKPHYQTMRIPDEVKQRVERRSKLDYF